MKICRELPFSFRASFTLGRRAYHFEINRRLTIARVVPNGQHDTKEYRIIIIVPIISDTTSEPFCPSSVAIEPSFDCRSALQTFLRAASDRIPIN